METKKPLQVTILNRNDQTRERIETNAIILASMKEEGNPVVRLWGEDFSNVDRFCLYAAIKRYSEQLELDNPEYKTLYQELDAEGAFQNEHRERELTEKKKAPEIEEEEEEPYEDPDAHTHDYDEYGECKICGAIQYKSCLWFELYGGEP